MFEFRPNLPAREEKIRSKEKKRADLKDRISAARTLRRLRQVLTEALEEGEL